MLVRYPGSSYKRREFITADGDGGRVFAVASKVSAVGRRKKFGD
jgi:hypothetical protein